MTTLNILSSKDFSGQTLSGVDLINFINTDARILVSATFGAGQFDNTQILDGLTINGSTGRNGIAVKGGSVSGATWNFTNWDSGDTVTINGTANGDSLTGSSQADRIYGNDGDDEIIGGLGQDRTYGGNGDDTFRYVEATQLANNEVIDGGAGTADLLVIEGTKDSSFDFRSSTISGVEMLQFEGGGEAKFTGSQIGGGGITEVIGNLIPQTLTVSGQLIDLSGVAFTAWDDATDGIILRAHATLPSAVIGSAQADDISGGMSADTLIGGGGNDRIGGGWGGDVLSGGEGDDLFIYSKANDLDAGETLDGGAGIDTIGLTAGAEFDFSKIAMTSIERVSFGLSGGTAILSGSQIGSLPGLIHTIAEPFVGGGQVTVLGPAVDLTGVTFENWSLARYVTIDGQADAANSLTGSIKADVITGGNLGDTINGGKGVDFITGGLGKDTLTGGNQTDYFIFTDSLESSAGAARDRITDFSLGNDIIDVSSIDAISGGSDDGFVFKSQAAFDGAGQLRYFVTAGGNTIVEADTDGNLAADFQIVLNGSIAFTEDEFIL